MADETGFSMEDAQVLMQGRALLQGEAATSALAPRGVIRFPGTVQESGEIDLTCYAYYGAAVQEQGVRVSYPTDLTHAELAPVLRLIADQLDRYTLRNPPSAFAALNDTTEPKE